MGESNSLRSAISLSTARHSATKPPVIDAQRVPPSASMTSQSMVIVRSPNFVISTA